MQKNSTQINTTQTLFNSKKLNMTHINPMQMKLNKVWIRRGKAYLVLLKCKPIRGDNYE